MQIDLPPSSIHQPAINVEVCSVKTCDISPNQIAIGCSSPDDLEAGLRTRNQIPQTFHVEFLGNSANASTTTSGNFYSLK